MSLTLHLADAAATQTLGARLAPALTGGMIVTLAGDLGTGKTTLVRGLLRARGIEGAVKSPTYTLVEHYLISSLYFYHFDFYRFTNQNEWDSAGMSDYFRSDAVCIVEWPERVGDRLPHPDLALSLSYAAQNDGRDVVATAHTPDGERCLTLLAGGALQRR
ncbi:MAG TPA: tRNA (adenosine(37)-N6)-threonylcarbamoyltransferase complex ATPase subunit type 1 TsaE [Casimicrobiaceae bacterium]|nr:tRNA (adenosine(37)-N6)-threonylcarbamoyltransferase complex ATPase subunit type 1 TsaE [Casimicrobiaceae bacterium]